MLRNVLIQKGLSNREAEVTELVAKGLSNKEIGNRLFVTERTVKFHLQNIYKKMNVKSRAQLIVWCLPHMGFDKVDTTPKVGDTVSTDALQPGYIYKAKGTNGEFQKDPNTHRIYFLSGINRSIQEVKPTVDQVFTIHKIIEE